MFPFRLLQFGPLFVYPFTRLGCKTPRDFQELTTPSNLQFRDVFATAHISFNTLFELQRYETSHSYRWVSIFLHWLLRLQVPTSLW